MKFCKIQDTLNRCSSFLDVACIALDNEHFFPEGNTVSLLLEDVNNRINTCVEELVNITVRQSRLSGHLRASLPEA